MLKYLMICPVSFTLIRASVAVQGSIVLVVMYQKLNTYIENQLTRPLVERRSHNAFHLRLSLASKSRFLWMEMRVREKRPVK